MAAATGPVAMKDSCGSRDRHCKGSAHTRMQARDGACLGAGAALAAEAHRKTITRTAAMRGDPARDDLDILIDYW